MEGIRYFLGVATLILVPLGLLYWLIIHRWARFWRKWGPIRTYLAVLPVLAALGVLLFQVRGPLLSTNLGTNWILIGIALVLSCLMTWLEFQYWRQLSISTLVGILELSQQRKGRLLREGIYGVVRHPRYLSAGIGMIVNALIVNYLGLYILLISVVPPGYLMLVLEERELLDRFGDAYREYQWDVPRLIPRLRRGG
ncbi:MAG: isoprenylcysteine carboxylmethyltransferase family protein [Acidobacteriia bacterium]|nr:isoprenylcysteine carboxylmethyltransferase family protein [Terriglobia bacterium]